MTVTIDELAQELAQLRSEIATLRSERVTHREATVTAVDAASSTFSVKLDDEGNGLIGIPAPPQFLPAVGDAVELLLSGPTPLYRSARVAAGAITETELDPAVVSQIQAGGVTYFTASAAPTYSGDADSALWIDTSNGYRINRWDGGAWQQLPLGTNALEAGAVTATVLAGTAIDGKVITGATLRTAASGQRIQMDSTNGLIGVNSAGVALTRIDPATGKLTATSATINGEINTGASGTARVRVYEGVDGKGSPMGIVAFEDGVSGDLPAQVSGEAYSVGGGGMSLDGGTYSGKKAGSLVLQTDGIAPEVDITASGGRIILTASEIDLNAANTTFNGDRYQQVRVWRWERSNFTANTSDNFGAGAFASLMVGTLASAPRGSYLALMNLDVSAPTSVAYLRFMVGGANASADARVDTDGAPEMHNYIHSFNWGGGDLTLQCYFQSASTTGTVYTHGSSMTLTYLGPIP